MSPRKIAILVTGLGPGGAERVIAQLAEHWSNRGHEITVFTFDAPADKIFHPLPASVSIRRLDCPKGGMAGYLQRLLRLTRALRTVRADILVSFLTKNNLLASIAKTGTHLDWIACERNNPERQKTHPMWNRMLHFAYRRADAIVCQTNGVRRCFPAATQDRIAVIPNPIKPMDRRERGRGTRIAAVGRLDRQKGFDLLVDAFARIAPRHTEWSLDIWGEGPERHSLQRQIESRGMTGRIHLRGVSDRPGGWMEECDIFVLASRYEGFPNVLGEAMSAGLPVIATNCDFGHSEMVKHGRNGLIVSPGNKASLAAALDRLISDEALRRQLAEEAPAAVKGFATADVMRKWDRLIAAVADGRNSSDRIVTEAHEVHPAQ